MSSNPLMMGYKGNCRSGVALAMRHRLSGLSTYRLKGQCAGDEHPAYVSRHGPFTFFYLPVPGWSISTLVVVWKLYGKHSQLTMCVIVGATAVTSAPFGFGAAASEFCLDLRIRASRGREFIYVLQMFFSVFCFFPSATKYETTVLGNG